MIKVYKNGVGVKKGYEMQQQKNQDPKWSTSKNFSTLTLLLCVYGVQIRDFCTKMNDPSALL